MSSTDSPPSSNTPPPSDSAPPPPDSLPSNSPATSDSPATSTSDSTATSPSFKIGPPLRLSLNDIVISETTRSTGAGPKYVIKKCIGFADNDSTVYEARRFPAQDSTEQPIDVSLKVSKYDSSSSYKKYENYQCQHPNILLLKADFFLDSNTHCCVFPLMDGSLRSLMHKVFPNGMPEDLVKICMKEAGKGLKYLHDDLSCIWELNAGHIYYTINPPQIQIGYTVTLYDHQLDYNQEGASDCLLETAICDWGCPPEVYNSQKKYQKYTRQSDLWLLGITALELAFGGIRVKDRTELELLIKETIDNNRGHFSDSFRDLLGQCLKQDPEERPKIKKLLKHESFGNHNHNTATFSDAVRLLMEAEKQNPK